MAPSKPVLGYWDIRGFAQQIRLLLTYLKVDFEDKQYGFGDGAVPTTDAWLADKFNLGLELPNLPYWIDENIKLSESKAILKYVTRTRGPALVPPTPELQAKADMIEGFANDLQRTLVNLAYSPTGVPAEPLETSLAPKFEQLSGLLTKSKWTVGDNLTYVDFYVYEVLLQFTKFNPDFLKPYSVLTKYVDAFEALPELSEYVKSTNNLISYSPFATLKF